MDVKVIRSGRNKIQLLVEGFRYYRTKGPMGGCKARAATSGPISTEEVNVKYHNRPTHPHNHPPNFADNVNAEIRHEFRTAGRNEPHQPSKWGDLGLSGFFKKMGPSEGFFYRILGLSGRTNRGKVKKRMGQSEER